MIAFEIGTGTHSEMSQRILFEGSKFTGFERGLFFQYVLIELAAGKELEEAISNTSFAIITTNVEE